MALAAPEDAAAVLEQFIHDIANTPAEVTHLLEELQAKDLQIAAYKDEVNKRDAQLQKWVRMNGGHVLNPKEDAFSKTMSDCYDKCEILQAEKCGLGEKALIVLERQIKRLDVGLRGLSAREEFPSDWNGPSLLSASGHATGMNTPITGGGGAVPHHGGPLQALSGNAPGGAPNIANAAQMRMAAQAAGGHGGRGAGVGGTQTPTNMPRTQREGSSEANKRRRLNTTLPAASSNLRQSSLGPGTPKAGTPVPPSGTSRAGSQQPAARAGVHKKGGAAAAALPSKKAPQPPAPAGRKRDRNRKKGGGDRRRNLKTSDRATPSTNASLSSEEDSGASPTPSSLPRSQADGTADRRTSRKQATATQQASEDEEEEEDMDDDNGPYCICQRGSFGEMVCCDNDNCEYQWFHFGCVGMKEQPPEEWLCPSCRKLPRGKIVISRND